MSTFYDELDRREMEARFNRLQSLPADLHDYQGCANDEAQKSTEHIPFEQRIKNAQDTKRRLRR